MTHLSLDVRNDALVLLDVLVRAGLMSESATLAVGGVAFAAVIAGGADCCVSWGFRGPPLLWQKPRVRVWNA